MFSLLRSARDWIIGHRGASGEATENTLDSLTLAIAQGADMIEVDAQLTRDGRLVAFHDWDLERLSGERQIVEQSLLHELQRVGLRADQPEDSGQRKIPSLREVLIRLPAAIPLNIELKRRNANLQAMAEELRALLQIRQNILISSFDWKLLAEVQKIAPNTNLAPIGRESSASLLETAARLDACSLHCSRRIVDRSLIDRAEAQARPVLVYTVNEAQEARELFDLGVRGVFTDFPGRLREELNA